MATDLSALRATNLGALRKARGLSQEDLAERVGLSTSQISRYETCERDPRLTELRLIARTLGVGVSDLIGESAASRQEAEGIGPEDCDTRSVARRLKLLRIAKGGEDPESFAPRSGLGEKWVIYEEATALPPAVDVLQLRKLFGITLDWVFAGDERLLAPQLLRDLIEAEKLMEEEDEPLPPRPPNASGEAPRRALRTDRRPRPRPEQRV